MDDSLVSVAALHALVYCERLFFLEEVERIRVADERVYAGRRLHTELGTEEEGNLSTLTFESHRLGVRGRVDVLRRRDGSMLPVEHKRGRSAGTKGNRQAWDTDRVQVGAYALLIEEAYGQSVGEGRVRYHADNVTVRVPVDDDLRRAVRDAVCRARELQKSVYRPPVSVHEARCETCSLARVCLPEEARLAADPAFRPIRLLPPHPTGMTLHVAEGGSRIGRRGTALQVRPREESPRTYPTADVGAVVVHGFAQISSQAIQLCVDRGIALHWMSGSGALMGTLIPAATSGHRHLRQMAALSDPSFCFILAQQLVKAKLEGQLRYLLRATRGDERASPVMEGVDGLRAAIRGADRSSGVDELRGYEGAGAAAYFGALPEVVAAHVDPRLRPGKRSRRPANDRFSALLNYAYGMLHREVTGAIVAVGLHPAIGFYHRPRSAAPALSLDLMELFRVPLADIPVVGAVNRKQFDADADFEEHGGRITLTKAARRKLIDVIERRRTETWKHDVVGYSLSYARILELEVRLLEKEWMGEAGLFARLRIR